MSFPGAHLCSVARVVALDIEHLAVVMYVHDPVAMDRPELPVVTLVVAVRSQGSICTIV